MALGRPRDHAPGPTCFPAFRSPAPDQAGRTRGDSGRRQRRSGSPAAKVWLGGRGPQARGPQLGPTGHATRRGWLRRHALPGRCAPPSEVGRAGDLALAAGRHQRHPRPTACSGPDRPTSRTACAAIERNRPRPSGALRPTQVKAPRLTAERPALKHSRTRARPGRSPADVWPAADQALTGSGLRSPVIEESPGWFARGA
jgi:hypothetical protein